MLWRLSCSIFNLQAKARPSPEWQATAHGPWVAVVREKSSTNSGCWTSDIDVKSDCSYMNLSSKPDFNHKQLKSHHPRSLTVLFSQGPNSGWPWKPFSSYSIQGVWDAICVNNHWNSLNHHIYYYIPTLQSFRCVPAISKSARALWLWCQWFQQGVQLFVNGYWGPHRSQALVNPFVKFCECLSCMCQSSPLMRTGINFIGIKKYRYLTLFKRGSFLSFF